MYRYRYKSKYVGDIFMTFIYIIISFLPPTIGCFLCLSNKQRSAHITLPPIFTTRGVSGKLSCKQICQQVLAREWLGQTCLTIQKDVSFKGKIMTPYNSYIIMSNNDIIPQFIFKSVGNETSPERSEGGDYDSSSVKLKSVMIASIKWYRRELSPLMPPNCRFLPTCSNYAIQAIEEYGAIRGGLLTAWRIFRCNPFGGYGYDPPQWPPPSFFAGTGSAKKK